MNLINIFNTLGLKNEHLKVYIANLEWGETIITNVSRKAGIPRSTVYILMKDLLNLGLVTQIVKQDKTFYMAAEPELIEKLLLRKNLEINQSIQDLQNNLLELKAMQTKGSKKPKVEYLEGEEGIKQAYERTFEAEEIWIQCLTETTENVVSEDYFEDYFKRFFEESNIKSKEILKLDDEDYVSKYSSEKNLQLRVDIKEKTDTDFWVYDNKVTFVSFNKERPYAFVIEDEDIARSMKIMYDLAWKRASKVDSRVAKGEVEKTEF